MKAFKRTIFKKSNGYLSVACLLTAVVLTFSSSYTKHFLRVEYPLRLALSEHFTFDPGKTHIFKIPYDGYYAVRLWGGCGGDSKNFWNTGHEVYELGGLGGIIEATAYFKEGEILTVTVATKGSTSNGGFNGGGNGGVDTASLYNDYFGGGGGGATDIRLSPGTLNDRILVAGGGGGGSGGNLNAFGAGYPPAGGGDGGGKAENHFGTNGLGSGGGSGGQLTAGGEGFQHGGLGTGGGGRYSGGGGGGGYYGGGGSYGSGGGGGGGSSYIGEMFTKETVDGLPGRRSFQTDEKDGYAIVSFLGNR